MSRRAWILVAGMKPQPRHAPEPLPWEAAKRTAREQRAQAHRVAAT